MNKLKKTPTVCIRVLPGEPIDGSGRVCIHLFVQDARGRIVEPCVLHPVIGEDGQQVKQKLQSKPTRGRLACDLNKLVAPVVKDGVTHITMRTGAVEAVTCLKCKQSKEYVSMMSATTKGE